MDDPDKYDFLADKVTDEQPVIEAEPVAEVPETVATPEPPAPEVPTTPEPREEVVPLAALRAEREKRQRYEAELAKYREQQAQQFDPQVFYQDPSSISAYVENRLVMERINLSRDFVASMHDDYEAMEEVFVEEAAKNPALKDEMLRSGNPAMFAYKYAKGVQTMREIQTGDLEKRLRAEIEAKVRAELSAKPPVNVPPDLSATRSATVPETVPDDSLESILKSKR